MSVTFTAESGNRYDFIIDENGDVDYSEVKSGKYAVEMFDENGETIMWYELEVEKAQEPVIPDEPNVPETPDVPDEPTTPEQPENPDKPETPDEPSEPTTPDEPNDTDKPTDDVESKSGNGGLVVGILIALVLLAAGGVTTFLLTRKNKKNKKNKGE